MKRHFSTKFAPAAIRRQHKSQRGRKTVPFLNPQTNTNKSSRILRGSVLACIIVAAACSPQEKFPQTYGTFAWKGSDWTELAGEKVNTSLDLASDTRFLIHDKSVAELSKRFEIHRKVYMRNEIHQDKDGTNKVVAKTIKLWDLKENSETMVGKFYPVKDHPEMIIWKPDGSLAPGVYEPHIGNKLFEAFVVDKASVLSNVEGSPACVDRILTRKFMWDNPIPAQYVSCSASNVGTPQPSAQAPTPATAPAPSTTEAAATTPPQPDNPNSTQPLNPTWFGRWESLDSKRIYTISADAFTVTQRKDTKDGYGNFVLKWVGKFNSVENTVGYAGKSVSGAQLAQDFEEALKQSSQPGSDQSVGNAGVARNALSGFLKGNYKLLTGYLGGDCAIWDWAIEGDMLLEISRCKYSYTINLLTRMK